MDYEEALQEALAAINSRQAQQGMAANIEAGDAAYGQLKDQASVNRSLEQRRLAQRMAEKESAIREDVMSRPDFEEAVEAAKKEPVRKEVGGKMRRGDAWNISDPYTGQAIENRPSGIAVSIGIYYTVEEKVVMTYLYQKGDEETLEKYKDSLGHIVNERRTLSDQAFIRKTFQGDNGWEQARLIFGSFVEMPNSIAALGESGYNLLTGQPTDPYSQAQQMAARPQYVRGESLKNASPILKQLGNIGYGMGDMLMLLPLGPQASLAVMASEAGGQMSNSIIQRGGTNAEAFTGGVIAAAIEWATESIPIHRLFKMAEPLKGATGEVIKRTFGEKLLNIFTQAGIEGTEGWMSEVANGFTDYILMGEKSQLGMRLAELIESGVDPGEAQVQAFNEIFVENPVRSFLEEGIAGGLFSAGANVVSDVRTNIQQNAQTAQAPTQQIEPNKLFSNPFNAPLTQLPATEIQTKNTSTAPGLTEMETAYTADMLNERIQGKIQENIQTDPEGARNALTEGMTALTKIETRIKADSRNINHKGINTEASQNTYTDFASGRGNIETAAIALAEDIRNAIGSGELAVREMVQLGYILSDIVGDADLAGEYIRPAFATRGGWNRSRRGEPGVVMAGITPGDMIRPLNDGRIQPFTTMDKEGRSGYNIGQTSRNGSYDAYLRMLDEVDAANRAGMTAREFAESKGVISTLTDAEAEILDKYDIRMQPEEIGSNGKQGTNEIKGDYTGKPYRGERNPDIDFTDRKGNSTFKIHFKDHAGELGYNTEVEYKNGANNFLEKPPTSTTQSFVSNEGTYFRYDTATNEFGIINKYGGISTYFKPDDGIAYWLDQIKSYAPK